MDFGDTGQFCVRDRVDAKSDEERRLWKLCRLPSEWETQPDKIREHIPQDLSFKEVEVKPAQRRKQELVISFMATTEGR